MLDLIVPAELVPAMIVELRPEQSAHLLEMVFEPEPAFPTFGVQFPATAHLNATHLNLKVGILSGPSGSVLINPLAGDCTRHILLDLTRKEANGEGYKMASDTNNRIADGSISFEGGVDSGKVTTVRSEKNPNGLSRNQLAWMENGTVRGGGISPRTGWEYLLTIRPGAELYGGGWMYQPQADVSPYLVFAIGGKIYTVRIDTDNSVNALLPTLGSFAIPNRNGYFFTQAEEFLVMQPGDGVTPPFFYWETPGAPGYDLRQSNGFNVAPFQIPPATAMDYYMGRFWYARGREYGAGDIVGGPSGTVPYGFRNSVLQVTECPLCNGSSATGDNFTIPAGDGHIRAIAHTSNVNTQLGQGQLYIFTRKSIYSLAVPVDRTAWIATTANAQPLQTVVQRKWGAVGDRCVVPLNGDLFYQTMEPGIRSLALAVRNATQWGNTPISSNVNRILDLNDRALARYAPGMEFDNRLWQGVLPVNIPGVGVAFQSVVALDFDLVSSFEDKLKGPAMPSWEGSYSGLDILQLFTGDFGGRDRAFAVVFSRTSSSIQLWELTDYARRENGDNRIAWYFETPAYTWGQELSLKELNGAELWIDELSGKVDFTAYYRPDQDPCWHLWTAWSDCALRGPDDNTYPAYCDEYRAPKVLPAPPYVCVPGQARPSNIGFQFQFRLEVRGWCRIRGLLLYALPKIRPPFGEQFVCGKL